MLLNGLLFAAAAAAPLSAEVEVSPAVVAVVAKYGTTFGPEAERELESLQAGGDRTAAALLGELLSLPGRADGPDFVRSCDYSEAAGRHASALHNLATCHFAGMGRPRDLARARELYGEASGMGFAKAACALGNMMIRGDGGARDPAGGLALCRRAADAGEADAQTDYGGYLLTNEHVPKDAVEARRYLALAAAKRQGNAAFLLGQIYWNGDGTAKDGAQAAHWWAVAYEAGRRDAALLLGFEAVSRMVAAHEARGPIPASALSDAERWLKIAAEKDPDPARRGKAVEMLSNLAVVARRRD